MAKRKDETTAADSIPKGVRPVVGVVFVDDAGNALPAGDLDGLHGCAQVTLPGNRVLVTHGTLSDLQPCRFLTASGNARLVSVHTTADGAESQAHGIDAACGVIGHGCTVLSPAECEAAYAKASKRGPRKAKPAPDDAPADAGTSAEDSEPTDAPEGTE